MRLKGSIEIGSNRQTNQQSRPKKPRQPSPTKSTMQPDLKVTENDKNQSKNKQPSPLDQFQFLASLGDGAYSKVYKVKRKADDQHYALKMVQLKNLSDKERENAINEVRILASIKHPNVIMYKESFMDVNSESLCIVMELVDAGDLYA